MACEAEKKRVNDLLQQIKDLKELQASTGLSKLSLMAAWAWKYGTDDVGPLKLRSDLEDAQEALALCMGKDLGNTIFGEKFGKILDGLTGLASYIK
jgi:hypothetical protein